jgi:hypothetical protein
VLDRNVAPIDGYRLQDGVDHGEYQDDRQHLTPHPHASH